MLEGGIESEIASQLSTVHIIYHEYAYWNQSDVKFDILLGFQSCPRSGLTFVVHHGSPRMETFAKTIGKCS